MPQYIDSYYLVNQRSSCLIEKFFHDFAPSHRELACDYPVPQYSDDTEITFFNTKELLSYLDQNPTIDYIIYWENLDNTSELKQITLQYTDDGKMIFGASIYGNEVDSKESLLMFYKVKRYLNVDYACITGEEPPPGNSEEFIRFCEQRYVPLKNFDINL
ncbi:hypothetical protein JET18_04100 [Chryseobacterium sp. L7]|uniref:Uncharacterized protein n=1 Tax=Chryseobacterium endalhagicum TaxID=2797638 RepID=A0ABS1QBT8_9FLAO|nr:hypothetical protein [Chryseobacterium endalhagicum]MBL1220006.1 hypothetical protein [Chryseobacterium endalhagicum]